MLLSHTKNSPTTVVIFEIFLVFYQTFLLPQAKWSDITGNKNDKYNLPHELPNNLKFRILRE